MSRPWNKDLQHVSDNARYSDSDILVHIKYQRNTCKTK